MNILHIVIGRPKPEASNGVLKSVYQLSLGQSLLGHDVNVLSIRNKLAEKTEVINLKFKVHLFMRNKARFIVDNDLKIYLKDNAKYIDIVHFHSGYHPEYWVISRMVRKLNIAYVISPRGGYQQAANRRNFFVKKIYKSMFENNFIAGAASVHALNQQEASSIGDYGVSVTKIEIVPNGVDYSKIDEVSKSIMLNDTLVDGAGFTIVYCGRIDAYYKGLDLLVCAISKLIRDKSLSDIKLKIIGPDWKGGKKELEESIARFGVSRNVEFLGELYGVEKFIEYSKSDIFILPSRTEGMPTSVLEAMAFGIPCVVTMETNIDTEVIEAGGCIPIKLDSRDIADQIAPLLADPERLLECARIGKEWVKANYTNNKIVKMHLCNYAKSIAK